MPEYSQLETFIKYNKFTFRNDLEKINAFFCELGFNQGLMNNWIKEIDWKVEDNGFVYTGCNLDANIITFENSPEIHIRPIILGMSKEIFNDLKDDILIIEILFYTEEIYDFCKKRYKEWFLSVTNNIVVILKKYFFEFGIYLTDEASDMKPLNGFVFDDWSEILMFDLAVIPDKYI
ncbi:hypothetical protein [Clostridium puniceum]|uniref:hypothetical protein n=1 Tax=Clostridium puniceum TaxID=29367 RepID=UPI00098C535C|nr:hypothetical protein [Clostridium puniceum]